MPRYINEDVLLKRLSKVIERYRKEDASDTLLKISDAVIGCPSADVVEVVRCKDCVYYDNVTFCGNDMHYGYCANRHDDIVGSRNRFELDFCSYGERKGGAE